MRLPVAGRGFHDAELATWCSLKRLRFVSVAITLALRTERPERESIDERKLIVFGAATTTGNRAEGRCRRIRDTRRKPVRAPRRLSLLSTPRALFTLTQPLSSTQYRIVFVFVAGRERVHKSTRVVHNNKIVYNSSVLYVWKTNRVKE